MKWNGNRGVDQYDKIPNFWSVHPINLGTDGVDYVGPKKDIDVFNEMKEFYGHRGIDAAITVDLVDIDDTDILTP